MNQKNLDDIEAIYASEAPGAYKSLDEYRGRFQVLADELLAGKWGKAGVSREVCLDGLIARVRLEHKSLRTAALYFSPLRGKPYPLPVECFDRLNI